MTSIDIYVTITFLILLLEGLYYFVIHEFAMKATGDGATYRSDQFPEALPSQVNWWTGAPLDLKNSNSTGVATNQHHIHVFDKCMLMFFVIIFIFKNIWYYSVGRQIHQQRRNNKNQGITTLRNTKNHKEYMLQENKKGMFLKFDNSEVGGVPNKDEESNVTSPLLA